MRSIWIIGIGMAFSAHAADVAGKRPGPVAVFEGLRVDTAKARVSGLFRIRNPTSDTLFLFPLDESFPLGQIEITLHRKGKDEVVRGWGDVDAACYVPDTLLPGGEVSHPLSLGYGRWRTPDADFAKIRQVSQVRNPLQAGVEAIGVRYQLKYQIDRLKQTVFDGKQYLSKDCPYRYYLEPIVAPPVEVHLPE